MLNNVADHAMAQTGAQGLAIAVTEPGRVIVHGSWGIRNAKGEPLQADTVMYGASLTKTAFAYYVNQLAQEGKLDLDQPIARLLPRPLPEYSDPQGRYAPWSDLAGDPRWQQITPRMALNHATGFANFFWLNPDQKLTIHFTPGSRYAYSGDGIILLQYAIEKGLGIDVGQDMQRRLFDRFAMPNSSLIWRPDFAANLADGWKADGAIEPHDERSKVRAAGSLDTTIADMARLSAGISADRPAMAVLAKGTLKITTASQFPPFQPELAPAEQVPDLAAGLGVVTFAGPQGPGWFKGGHNDSTGNMWVCLLRSGRCVVILSNDVRAEAAFPDIVRRLLGDTGLPWQWEYGVQPWTKALTP
ncbi:serine hydrolase domain-containing protein [Novosphingobium sp. B 225]|uniref:serine hydrolase domain-containing protein n=1 Tax=Novosphingobium sp. B 225 TaxID=1961849 RepID=UPI001C3D545E|nr:serine hydrolase domain-containing protein [Novosphingobium sp. B 225]